MATRFTLPCQARRPPLLTAAPVDRRPSPRPSLFRAATLLAACLVFTLSAPLAAREHKKKQKPPQPPPELAEKQADLGELRSRIKELRKDLDSSEEDKADAAERLRESERQVSRLEHELEQLSEQRSQIEAKLRNLEGQSRELGSTLNQQQSQLERLLYKQYLRGNPDSLQLLLNGNDPNQTARDLHYMSAIALARAELMGEISASLERKKTLAADAKARAEELQEVAAQQQQRRSELEKQRAERQKLYAQLADKVKAQRREIGQLQQDEKRLTQLVDRLSNMLAKQAAEAARAARAAEATKQAEAARQKNKPNETSRDTARTTPPPEPAKPPRPSEAENRYEPVASDGSFPRLRGSLRLPVRGAVTGRFGTARDGGGSWRGLFIKAGNGSEVKAVAAGRVVFADWMRGFGNLLIIDHGDAYMTIYGNNDALHKQVGQSVRGGETVATVGNSGASAESGLYFEIRHQGQPIDPMKWASLK